MTVRSDILDDIQDALFDASDGLAETVSYDPAGSGTAFDVLAIISRVDLTALAGLGYSDTTQAKILAASLEAESVTPTAYSGGIKGDTIARTGPAGSETWQVVKYSYSNGYWVLDIEKDLRFRP